MVGASGFEPLTTRTPSVCATRLRYAPTLVGCRIFTIPSGLKQFSLVADERRAPRLRGDRLKS